MTSLIYSSFVPHRKLDIKSPLNLECSDISVLVPVKNNQLGIDNFLKAFFSTHSTINYPCEIIIVDNNSDHPIFIREKFRSTSLPIYLLRCYRVGPASARNLGIKHSKGQWVVFTDSDCLPTESFLTGYKAAINGAVGYAGNVKALSEGALSHYYETQEILIPPPVEDDVEAWRPHYIITANAMIWKPALELIGGFDEGIQIAAGEDIDLGFRLSEIGKLSYAQRSLVYHDFGKGFLEFIRRFKRYGKGNRLVGIKHGVNLKPQPFEPAQSTGFNWLMSRVQYLALLWGYYTNS